MRWTVKDYYRFFYKRYRIKLVGWDPRLLFANLSDLTGLPRISRLAALWESGVLHYERVSDEEFEAPRNRPILVAPSPLNRGCACGFGGKNTKKRLVCVDGYSPRYERNGLRSVTAEGEEWAGQGMEVEEDPITSFSDDESPSRPFRNAVAGSDRLYARFPNWEHQNGGACRTPPVLDPAHLSCCLLSMCQH